MRIAVTGKEGQVVTALLHVGTTASMEVIAVGRPELDLARPETVLSALEAIHPDVIVSAAAYTAVDKAESERDLAFAVNAAGAAAVAQAAAHLGVPVIHLSTDYVFDGTKPEPYVETDPSGPVSVYGASKLAGEDAVRAAGGVHVILRTSWVVSAHGANFVKTMLRLSETRAALSVVCDQIGGPTPARAIAEACVAIAGQLRADPAKSGSYHFSGAPDVSWADFAREIFAQAARRVAVTNIPSSDYPTPAKRPANSRLDCQTTEAVFGIKRPNWKVGLAEILNELEIFR